MRRKSAFLASAAVCAALMPSCTLRTFRGEAPFQGTAGFQEISRVLAETQNGTIHVRCVPSAQEVQVQATRHASGTSPEDARAHAEKIQIVIQRSPADPAQLDIRAEFPNERGRNEGASFDITLPPTAALSLTTGNGQVTVSGAEADVDVRTSNGRIEATHINGSVRARTSNGAVRVEDVSGNLDLTSSNGAIDIQRAGIERVQAVTSNGHIRAIETRGDVSLRSSNGRLEWKPAAIPDQPNVTLVTSNGSVDVELPAAISARLRARTTNGKISASWADLPVTALESSRHSLSATLRDGDGTVEIESSNGSISIRTRGGGVKAEIDDSGN